MGGWIGARNEDISSLSDGAAETIKKWTSCCRADFALRAQLHTVFTRQTHKNIHSGTHTHTHIHKQTLPLSVRPSHYPTPTFAAELVRDPEPQQPLMPLLADLQWLAPPEPDVLFAEWVQVGCCQACTGRALCVCVFVYVRVMCRRVRERAHARESVCVCV